MSNPFTLDAIKTKKELEEDRLLAAQYVGDIDTLDDKIKRLFHVRNHKIDYDSSLELLRKLSVKKNTNKTNKGLIEEKKNTI